MTNPSTKCTNDRSYIAVRTQFEGYHAYPDAGSIDPRIKFLERPHRHVFHVTARMSVTHDDRELEFFLVKWALNDWIAATFGNTQSLTNSCESIATRIIHEHLIPKWGDRDYVVTVSEDGENEGIVEHRKPVFANFGTPQAVFSYTCQQTPPNSVYTLRNVSKETSTEVQPAFTNPKSMLGQFIQAAQSHFVSDTRKNK